MNYLGFAYLERPSSFLTLDHEPNIVSYSYLDPKQIRNRAAYLFRVMTPVREADLRLNRIVLVATALYLACKEQLPANPALLSDLAARFKTQGHRITPKTIQHALRILRPQLSKVFDYRKLRPTSQDYLASVVQKLRASEGFTHFLRTRGLTPVEYFPGLIRPAAQLLQNIPYPVRGGRNPYVFTVSVLYALGKGLSGHGFQKALANATGVSEFSIRAHVRVIQSFLNREEKD